MSTWWRHDESTFAGFSCIFYDLDSWSQIIGYENENWWCSAINASHRIYTVDKVLANDFHWTARCVNTSTPTQPWRHGHESSYSLRTLEGIQSAEEGRGDIPSLSAGQHGSTLESLWKTCLDVENHQISSQNFEATSLCMLRSLPELWFPVHAPTLMRKADGKSAVRSLQIKEHRCGADVWAAAIWRSNPFPGSHASSCVGCQALSDVPYPIRVAFKRVLQRNPSVLSQCCHPEKAGYTPEV